MPAYHIICTSFSRDYRDYHGCFHPSEADGPNLHLQLPWLHSILGFSEANLIAVSHAMPNGNNITVRW